MALIALVIPTLIQILHWIALRDAFSRDADARGNRRIHGEKNLRPEVETCEPSVIIGNNFVSPQGSITWSVAPSEVARH